MITLPSDIQEGGSWDGSTGFDRHLESEMDFEEHQRIAFNALQLLAGNLAVPDDAAGAKLEALKEAYENGSPDDVLYISKGIHQPRSNPHMQLQLKRGKHIKYTYHLNVTMTTQDVQGLPERYFHWVGVQFTAEAPSVHGTLSACWPLVAALDCKGAHSRRRMSIAPKDVQGRIEFLAAAAQAAQEKAEKIENARLTEQSRALARNDLTKKLQTLKYTIPGNKTIGLNTLIDGGSLKIKTQTGKDMTIVYGKNGVQTAKS